MLLPTDRRDHTESAEQIHLARALQTSKKHHKSPGRVYPIYSVVIRKSSSKDIQTIIINLSLDAI